MPKRAVTRERIANKADELFCRFGPSKTSMTDLADALDMSPANIYKHFASKQALIEAVAERELCRLIEEVRRVALDATPVWTRIEAITNQIQHFHRSKLRNEEQMMRLVVDPALNVHAALIRYKHALHALLGGLLEEGVTKRQLVPSAANYTTAIYDCLLIAFDPLYAARTEDDDQVRRTKNVLTLLRDVLCAVIAV